MNVRSINLHIDKLILDGFDGLDARRLEAAVRLELQRLLSDQDTLALLRQSGNVDEIPALSISDNATVQEQSLGQQIASSVYKGISA